MNNKKFSRTIKRIFDLIAALGGLIILSPIILIVAILVRYNLGSPIIFVQERIGKDNKKFKMVKFRSMTNQKDKDGNLLPNKKRLTKFGEILRNSSLDELPELINVLKGDMSLVGPRPLPVNYLPLYSEEQLKRHNVLPGITGWAQINGRNSIKWGKKFELDIWYVENQSLLLDIKILFLTVFKVLKKENINQAEAIGMEDFNGEN